ncbi:MAG: methyltransferase [Candidatus Diapherotrites archaeon]|nr:methyltransferase [Candidatus Diapherotrites archaeon]MDZ4256321.1 hypothetical protein [archaeon]
MEPVTPFRKRLDALLTPAEKRHAVYAFDMVGDLALIEIPQPLQKKKKKIAHALLDANPRLTRVYEKVGQHGGKFRLENVRWLAGQKGTRTLHKEWGCVFAVEVGEAFFNPRLGTERQRVAADIKKGQQVCVFFAGVGPFAITIAKHAHPIRVMAIEWNPQAIPFLNENIRRNKVENIIVPLQGDISKISPIPEFDHVIMPAPETAITYLARAVEWVSPKGGLIHLYAFMPKDGGEISLRTAITESLSNSTRSWRISFFRKVSDFSPSVQQVCVGIKVGQTKSARRKIHSVSFIRKRITKTNKPIRQPPKKNRVRAVA